ncbi:MAG: glycogen synthase [Candidatus Nanopelagicales bacterium]
MKVGLLTREFPPDVYGGAGVHVDFLSRELRDLVDLSVHCWGDDRPDAVAHRPAAELAGANAALQTLSIDLSMAASLGEVELVHSHTWYANVGGKIAKILYGIPHVMTAHSLEPRRPWKVEQLGGGYRLSSWAERTAIESADAVIAVSAGMRDDVLACYPEVNPARVHVVHNGIDSQLYAPDEGTDVLAAYGIDADRPSVVFVGRITRQKGVPHLVKAARAFHPDAQVVLCAGAPDTPELGAEVAGLVEQLTAERSGVHWIAEMLPREHAIQLMSHATVFVVPSVYEPLGIVNLEAMACGTAVVASDVGGIPEVVDDKTTGFLVHYDESEPEQFEAGLAERVNRLLADPALAQRMGAAGRERAVRDFSWATVAQETVAVYSSVYDAFHGLRGQ